MLAGLARLVRQSATGIGMAVRARPRVFIAVTIGVFLLDLCLPPLVLSVARKPVDFFTFNPWLARLPEYLVSNQAAIGEKLAFLSRVALFWFSADSPYGGVEWGYAVDASDLFRFFFTSLVVGAYFALWLGRRDRPSNGGRGVRMGRQTGILGVLTSVLGLSTGPCSVMGCGAPVIPVMGLAFIGLSSGTLALLATLSKVGTTLVLTALTLGVAYLGWLVSVDPRSAPPIPSAQASPALPSSPIH